MKKLLLSLTIGAFLLGGVVLSNSKTNNDVKYLGAGGEKEPKLFSVYTSSLSL